MDNLTLRSVQIHPIWCSVTPSIDWAEGARMVVTRMIPVMVIDEEGLGGSGGGGGDHGGGD